MSMREVLSDQLQLGHVKSGVLGLETSFFPFEDWQKGFVSYTVRSAERVVAKMNQLSQNKEQGRKGGVLLILKDGEWPNGYAAMQVIGEDVGGKPNSLEEIEQSNPDKHCLYAVGKAMVLVNNKELLGSSQNANLPPDEQQHITLRGKDMPGGAIRVSRTRSIYSFSGYATPEEDECVILATLEEMGILKRQQAFEYADKLGNKLYKTLTDELVLDY